jgi:NADPH:quinone reductase-like Zn-dependent oxidoreductase
MASLLDRYRPKYSFLLASIPILYSIHRLFCRPRQTSRSSKISHSSERVLILGATSGIGRAIAHQYAERGARVCVVGRRQLQLDEVVLECGNKCFGVRGDFANVEDMVRIRAAVEGGE